MEKIKTNYMLDIATLPEGIHTFSYLLDDDFFSKCSDIEEVSGRVNVELHIERKSKSTELKFSFNGEMYVPCDICLDDVSLKMNREYSTLLEFDSSGNLTNLEELDIDYNDGIIDLESLFCGEILLNRPIKVVHEEGECNEEMLLVYNKYSKREDKKSEIDPRWAALKSINDKNK